MILWLLHIVSVSVKELLMLEVWCHFTLVLFETFTLWYFGFTAIVLIRILHIMQCKLESWMVTEDDVNYRNVVLQTNKCY